MSDQLDILNTTLTNATDLLESVVLTPLTKLENFTNELTYLIFDNQIINNSIGSSNLAQLMLLLITVFAITLGSFASIEQPSNALPPSEDHPLFDQTDKDCEPTPVEGHVSTSMVIMLPIVAGTVLLSMYYITKNYDKVKLSNVLNKYVIVMSFSSVSFVLSYLYNTICCKLCYIKGIDSTKVNKRFNICVSNDKEIHALGFEKEWMYMPEFTDRERIIKEERLIEIRSDIKRENQLTNFYFTTGNIFGFSFGSVFCILFAYFNGEKNWILNNILGFSIVTMGISRTKIPNFRIATLFLVLFFFYDIYFVFGTDVMLSVATNVDIPAKLVVPNIVSREEGKIMTSMLGLGDMALPGAFIALSLRFDLFNFHATNPNTEFHHLQKFNKPYFLSAIFGYIIGLYVTFKIVQIYKVGQPALLYLCPAVIIAVYSTAAYRGELGKLWKYDESPESEFGKNQSNNKGDENDSEVRIDIICSKETLFLSGEIADEDVDDKEDIDYEYVSEDDSDDEIPL